MERMSIGGSLLRRAITALSAMAGAAALPAAGAQSEEKSAVFPLKATSIDSKTHRIEVKESGYEIVWDEGRTTFYHHRSIPLKELSEGVKVEIHGKMHGGGGGPGKGGGGPSASPISDVDCIGTGSKFARPKIAAKTPGATWEQATLRGAPLFLAEIGWTRHRIAGDPSKLAVYSVEPLPTEKVKGAKIQIIGTSRKVTVERDGKPVPMTRITAKEVHLVDLNPEHERFFRLAWVERKQDPPATPPPGGNQPPGGPGGKKAKDTGSTGR